MPELFHLKQQGFEFICKPHGVYELLHPRGKQGEEAFKDVGHFELAGTVAEFSLGFGEECKSNLRKQLFADFFRFGNGFVLCPVSFELGVVAIVAAFEVAQNEHSGNKYNEKSRKGDY